MALRALAGPALAVLPRGFRHILEFRYRPWPDDAVFELMRRYLERGD